MTTRRGVCTNEGHCGLWATAFVQEVAADAPFVCRQCGHALGASGPATQASITPIAPPGPAAPTPAAPARPTAPASAPAHAAATPAAPARPTAPASAPAPAAAAPAAPLRAVPPPAGAAAPVTPSTPPRAAATASGAPPAAGPTSAAPPRAAAVPPAAAARPAPRPGTGQPAAPAGGASAPARPAAASAPTAQWPSAAASAPARPATAQRPAASTSVPAASPAQAQAAARPTGTAVPRPAASAPAPAEPRAAPPAPVKVAAEPRPTAAARPTGATARPATAPAPIRRAAAPATRPTPRFPVGVTGGAFLFAAMAGLAFWIVKDWTLTSAPPKVAVPAVPAAAPLAAPPAAGKPEVILRLAGSSTVAAQLAPALAEAYLASLGATGIQTSSPERGALDVRGTKGGAPLAIAILTHGPGPLAGLRDGSADVAITARRVGPDEARQLAELGTMTSPANEHVLGVDGLAVIVSKANPVSDLKREQLAAIFAGSASSWAAFGGAGPIHLYLPDEQAGAVAALEATVMRGGKVAAGARRLESDQAVMEAVVGDVSGVGLVALPWVKGVKAVAVGDSRRTPLIPTPFTLSGEEYLLSRRLYLYTAQAPANPHVSGLVDFALGPQGQAVVKKAGFVDLSLRAEPRPPPEGAPHDYVKLTAGAKRLSATFRFAAGSTHLDNRALSDLDRVVDFLREHDLNGASVRLAGFADNQGGPAPSKAQSRGRALRVAQALAQRGVSGSTLEGFGAALPVADNASEEGRERNRRVEIWVSF